MRQEARCLRYALKGKDLFWLPERYTKEIQANGPDPDSAEVMFFQQVEVKRPDHGAHHPNYGDRHPSSIDEVVKGHRHPYFSRRCQFGCNPPFGLMPQPLH